MSCLYERKISEFIWNIEVNDKDLFCSKLSTLLYELKREWKYAIFISDLDEKEKLEEYLCYLFCLIGHMRDGFYGYSERDLSYRMIYIWYSVFPILSIFALHTLFLEDDAGDLPYGGWKDFKYFCREISRISTYSKSDSLIDICISIVNHSIDIDLSMINEKVSDLCLFIPKETGAYSWLFDRLVLDRDPIMGHKGFMKKQFRLDISSLKNRYNDQENCLVCCHKGKYDIVSTNGFIGDYIRGVLCDLSGDWHIKWSKLVRSFSRIVNTIPIIVLTADITDEMLYHMIGYVCLLSCIRGSSGRVLILSTVPIWLDISDKWNDISGMASELWSYCKSRRTRVDWDYSVQFLLDAVSSMGSSNYHFFEPIKLFFFGSSFSLEHLMRLRDSSSQIALVLWKIGGDYIDISNYNLKGVLFLSGRSPSLMRNFYKVYNSGDSYSWNSVVLMNTRYDRLRNYFHSNISIKNA